MTDEQGPGPSMTPGQISRFQLLEVSRLAREIGISAMYVEGELESLVCTEYNSVHGRRQFKPTIGLEDTIRREAKRTASEYLDNQLALVREIVPDFQVRDADEVFSILGLAKLPKKES